MNAPNQTTIHAPEVAEPPRAGMFSNGKRIGDRFMLSGMHAGDGRGGILGGGDAYQQARHTFAKIAALVTAAGATMDDIVMLRVYLTDINDKAAVGKARAEAFTGDFPCSTLIQVAALVEPGLKVEIEAEGIVGSARPAARP